MKQVLTRWLTTKPSTYLQNTQPRQAVRAAELNEALSSLHSAQGTYSHADFLVNVLPIYQNVLRELQVHAGQAAAEQRVIDLLGKTADACYRASRTLLPAGRPGTDYRHYEIEYIDALVSAMAVACVVQANSDDELPQDVAVRVIPHKYLQRLRSDAMVWEDWLGFFQRSPLGGLYAVSCEHSAIPVDTTTLEEPAPHGSDTKRGDDRLAVATDHAQEAEPPRRSAATGWNVVDAIKACLADGTLSFNQPGDLVQVNAHGSTFLQTPAVFEAVRQLRGMEEGAKNMENRFLRLKINRQAPGGWKRFRGKSLHSEALVKGYVVDDGAIFWDQEVPHGRFVVKTLKNRP